MKREAIAIRASMYRGGQQAARERNEGLGSGDESVIQITSRGE